MEEDLKDPNSLFENRIIFLSFDLAKLIPRNAFCGDLECCLDAVAFQTTVDHFKSNQNNFIDPCTISVHWILTSIKYKTTNIKTHAIIMWLIMYQFKTGLD